MNNQQLIEALQPFVTAERFNLLQNKLKLRTRHITIVLENVHHEQNISAVIRTCECLGIQDLHIIENSNQHTTHPTIDRGADKWLNITRYNTFTNNSQICIEKLRQQGYRIVATTPHDDAENMPPAPGFGANYTLTQRSDSLYNFDISKGKAAIVIGSERMGISKYVAQHADDYITIPMVGFTESLNLSACTAIIASHLRQQMEKQNIGIGLSQTENDEIMVNWLIGSIRNADLVLKHILKNE